MRWGEWRWCWRDALEIAKRSPRWWPLHLIYTVDLHAQITTISFLIIRPPRCRCLAYLTLMNCVWTLWLIQRRSFNWALVNSTCCLFQRDSLRLFDGISMRLWIWNDSEIMRWTFDTAVSKTLHCSKIMKRLLSKEYEERIWGIHMRTHWEVDNLYANSSKSSCSKVLLT